MAPKTLSLNGRGRWCFLLLAIISARAASNAAGASCDLRKMSIRAVRKASIPAFPLRAGAKLFHLSGMHHGRHFLRYVWSSSPCAKHDIHLTVCRRQAVLPQRHAARQVPQAGGAQPGALHQRHEVPAAHLALRPWLPGVKVALHTLSKSLNTAEFLGNSPSKGMKFKTLGSAAAGSGQ